ncbi:putative holliday junction resolvase [Cohaesibacter sp. ES.047]|uniref:Holliday junction resolvase RuvX n=1 Tax=Cohaesibacter sp. ES.047 TaxID=1798205 RepID=UPI000BB76D15|nr:Holliday junction resolvase RuvX [Cohaesibacter sp. ES.047]SNY93900.1 putative holliday junction resolvase [Cohaesibacter sp. ES.047]
MARKKKKKAPIDIALHDLIAGLKRGQRLMGLDLGTKTIGVAVSDTGLVIASAIETIQRKKFAQDAERLIALCTEHNVGGLVLGLPLNMDGSEGPRSQATRDFYLSLRDLWREREQEPIPMSFWDERLSTVAVTRTLLDADASRARRGEVVDKMAASYILQGALDRARLSPSSSLDDNPDLDEDPDAT